MAYRKTLVVNITLEAMEEEDLESQEVSFHLLLAFLNSATSMVVEAKILEEESVS